MGAYDIPKKTAQACAKQLKGIEGCYGQSEGAMADAPNWAKMAQNAPN
jgi:hypothetical protein